MQVEAYCLLHAISYILTLFLYQFQIITAADKELVDDIFGDSDEEEFVGFSKEELLVHWDVGG